MKNLPMEEVYELYKFGYTKEQLANKYGVKQNSISIMLQSYCRRNGLEYLLNSSKSEKLELPREQIYKLYKEDYTVEQLAGKYKVKPTAISIILENYCVENGLEYKPHTQEKKLPMEEVYELYQKGYTQSQIAEKYGISRFTISERLRAYCAENNLEYIPNKGVRKEKKLPMAEIYKLYKDGYSYVKLASIYCVSLTTIFTRIKKYCTENNLEYIPNKKWRKEIELPMSEIYELYQKGYTQKQISEKYDVCQNVILRRIRKYCEENGLEYKPHIKKINLSVDEIYKLYKDGYSYVKLASIYHVSATTIGRRIKKYCAENNLEYIPNKGVRKEKKLPMAEIYKLYKDGYSYVKLASIYRVSDSTICKRIKKYCAENNLEYIKNIRIYKKIELPMSEIYELYQKGYTQSQIAEKYGVSEFTISERLRAYCAENNLEYIPNKGVRKEIDLPIAEIYKLHKEGYSQTKLASIYCVSDFTICKRIKKYCAENNLEYIPNKGGRKEIDLPVTEIYELYQKGYAQKQIAEKYNTCQEVVSRRIRKYCAENNLEYIKNIRTYKEIELPMAEIYKLYKDGYDHDKLASIYRVSGSTIGRRIKKYCDDNNITKEKRSNLPMHKVYYQYINGVSNEVLENKYGINEEILMQELYRYCSKNNIYMCENKLQEIKNKQILLYHLKSILKEERKQRENNELVRQKIK